MNTSESKINLISLSTTYPSSTDSKTPKFVHALNKELFSQGFNINVISPHIKGSKTKITLDSIQIHFFKYLPENFEIKKSIPDEVKTTCGKIKIFFMIFRFFLFSRNFCSKKENYILHGHWAFPAGYLAYHLSKKYKKKFIVTVHGSEIALLEKSGFLKKITINALNNSTKVIASNNYLKNKLIKLGVSEDNIELIRPIPNFVNHDIPRSELSDFREKFTSKNNKIILFVGRLTEVKGTKYLIKSLESLKTQNFHCIIVGGGPLENQLKKLANSLNVSEKITFFGSANTEQLGFLYNVSDVFVLPSVVDSLGGTEGTGLVIPEAMDCGVPVIASNVGGIPEIINDKENGILVEQKNPQSIAKAIDLIFSDTQLREKIIQNSKKTVQDFSPSEIGIKYFEILKKITD